MTKSILIVDDDELMRSFLSAVLREEGYRVEEARNGKEGLSRFLADGHDLVITDLKMPDMTGLELMLQGRKKEVKTPWIIITAFGSISSAVEAIKAGATDYLTKPLQSPDELRHVVRRVLERVEAEQTISLLSEELRRQFPPVDMIFLGEKMDTIYKMVTDVSPTSATILVSGPSGTGKELIARVIHALSPRKAKPFVAVNCGALVETLLESELFGHEKGAFTGAVSARKGRFELADGGTIFLDEVGEISQSMQVRLLRVLQERTFERVGGDRPVHVDIRVISATNRDLKTEVSAGRFREDLFYRLNVFPICLPPLVERRLAIVPLAEYFIRKYSASLGKKGLGLTEGAKNQLMEYAWPGNIRELQNVIERAVILSKEEIDYQHLVGLDMTRSAFAETRGLLRASEREAIERTLAETGGNRKKAAEVLGISLRTLQYRIREYGLS